jgi:hypothetical protein
MGFFRHFCLKRRIKYAYWHFGASLSARQLRSQSYDTREFSGIAAPHVVRRDGAAF